MDCTTSRLQGSHLEPRGKVGYEYINKLKYNKGEKLSFCSFFTLISGGWKNSKMCEARLALFSLMCYIGLLGLLCRQTSCPEASVL